VSYADMMTLLMVLFIVMFAISQVDQKKFAALKTGLSAGFGAPVAILNGGDAVLDPGGAVAPDSVNLDGAAKGEKAQAPIPDAQKVDPQTVVQLAEATSKAQVAKEVAELEQAREELKAALAEAGLPDAASFRFDERGLVVTIATDEVLFGSGSASLQPTGRRILDALAPTLKKVPNRVSVDGHTDSRPISTAQFPTNWELSTARATGVLRYLSSRQHIPATKMSATGFAETHPLGSNGTASGRALNRRVEIVVIAQLDNSQGRAVEQLADEHEDEAAQAEAKRQAAATLKAAADKAAAESKTAKEKAAAAEEAARSAALRAHAAEEAAESSTDASRSESSSAGTSGDH
jgi:chemotaxis protein MotB